MTSVHNLRDFVTERLTAAAREIVGVFEQTIVEYQAEIERQRRLLDVVWKPEIKLTRIELSCRDACKEEELLTDQRVLHQETNSTPDKDEPEPSPTMKEQHGGSSHEGEELVLKQETDAFVLNPTHEQSDRQLLRPSSPVVEKQEQEGAEQVGSELSTNADPELNASRGSCAHNSPVQGKRSLQRGHSGKASREQDRPKIHKRVHRGGQPHVCETCGKRFNHLSSLNAHVRTHTGETPHSCVTCGKRFKEKSKLKRHLAIHTGEKPHVCGTCGNRFSEPSKLNRHMTTHTNRRPYSCDTCGRRFKDTWTLKGHLKTHTDLRPFACKTCGRRFGRTTHLRKHMNVHTREGLRT